MALEINYLGLSCGRWGSQEVCAVSSQVSVIKEAASASACICPTPVSWGRGSKGWQELQIGGGRGRMQQMYAAG